MDGLKRILQGSLSKMIGGILAALVIAVGSFLYHKSRQKIDVASSDRDDDGDESSVSSNVKSEFSISEEKKFVSLKVIITKTNCSLYLVKAIGIVEDRTTKHIEVGDDASGWLDLKLENEDGQLTWTSVGFLKALGSWLKKLSENMDSHAEHVGEGNKQHSSMSKAKEIFERLNLFDSLFHDNIKDLLQQYNQLANDYNTILNIQIATQAPEIAQLPWEYIAKRERLTLTVTRLNISPEITREIPENDVSFLVLVTDTPNYREEVELFEHLKLGSMRIIFSEEDFLEALSKINPHILHIIGHGTINKLTRIVRRIDSETLPALVAKSSRLKIVTINACYVARASVEDDNLGLVAELIAEGVPTAIGMQFGISGKYAVEFTRYFYEIAIKQSVEAAINWIHLEALTRDTLEWVTPVVYRGGISMEEIEELKNMSLLFLSPLDGKEMIYVPAADGIGPFCIDKYPVTNAEYEKFCSEKGELPRYWYNHGYPDKNDRDSPVVNITRQEAQAYADWTGKRLPTLDELSRLRKEKNNTVEIERDIEWAEWLCDESGSNVFHWIARIERGVVCKRRIAKGKNGLHRSDNLGFRCCLRTEDAEVSKAK